MLGRIVSLFFTIILAVIEACQSTTIFGPNPSWLVDKRIETFFLGPHPVINFESIDDPTGSVRGQLILETLLRQTTGHR